MPPSFSVSGMLPNSHGLGGPAERAITQVVWDASISTHASPASVRPDLCLCAWGCEDPQKLQLIVQDPASCHLLQCNDTWEVTKLEAMNGPESIDNDLHDDGRIGMGSTIRSQW